MGGFCLFPVLVVKMNRNNMEKEEKDIRFVAQFYRENRLNTTKAWQKLGIRKERNHATLLYRLTAIAAVVGLIAGFSWWWSMTDRTGLSLPHPLAPSKKSHFRMTAASRWPKTQPYDMTVRHTARKTETSHWTGKPISRSYIKNNALSPYKPNWQTYKY